MDKLKDEENLKDFVDKDSKKHLEICNKIAAMLSNISGDEFGVTEEQMEQSVED